MDEVFLAAALAGGDEGAGGGGVLDSASGSDFHAVQSGHGVGEVEGVAETIAFEDGVAEGAMEDVAGTGGVEAVDDEGGGVDEFAIHAGDGAESTEGHGGDLHAELLLDHDEGAEGIAFVGPLGRKFGAGDEVVDVG